MKNEKRSSQIIIEENRRLKSAVEELAILNEIATAISSSLSLEQIIQLIAEKCIKHLHVEQCSVTLLENNSESSDLHTLVRKAAEAQYNHAYRLDDQLTGFMILNKKSLTINEIKNEKRVSLNINSYKGIRSLITVPLINKGKLTGLLNVFNKRGHARFNGDDERLLSIIASQSANVIENARLMEEEKKLHLIEEELKLAREIQLNLLPKQIPKIPGYEIAAVSVPAKEVGGDFYDFIKIDESRIAFCLGDVTGKGLPAAMLLANFQATLRGQLVYNSPLCTCLKRSNDLLHESTDSTKFVSLFLGMIDLLKANRISYCNGGHDHPFLIGKGGEVKRLGKGGVLLGCFPGLAYEEETVELKRGDLLVINSDGITDAHNREYERFGEERFAKILDEERNNSCQSILETVLQQVNNFSKGIPQFDDMTLLIIKKL